MTSLTPATKLEHHDRIVVGEDGKWLGDIIGTHETIDGEEVMLVLVVPTEAVFQVAGKAP